MSQVAAKLVSIAIKEMSIKMPKRCRNVSVVVISRDFGFLSFFVVILWCLTFLFDISVRTGYISVVVCDGFNGYLWFVDNRMRGFVGIQYCEDLTGSFIRHFIFVMKFSCILIRHAF